MRHHFRRFAAVAALVTATGVGAMAAPAMAASGCSGSSCTTQGNVTVAASITESINNAAVNFNNGTAVPAGDQVGPQTNSGSGCTWYAGPASGAPQVTPCPDFAVTVTTGDSAGYVIQGSGTDFTNSSTNTSFPIGNLTQDVGDAQGNFNTSHKVVLTGTAANVASSNVASASTGDAWPFADALGIPASAPNGSFSSTLTYTAIAS